MPFNLEKVVAVNAAIWNDDREDISAPAQRVNFNAFGAKEIRDVLKSKAHCLRAGFPAKHIIIATLNEIRDQYVLRVGLPTYLSQMLGDLAKVELKYCTLYTEEGQPIDIHLKENHDQSVQRFIAKHFKNKELPFRIEVSKDSNPDRAEVRYL